LARVGLPDAGPHRPADLSGGQQQRVAVARALAASPSLVLLDEPLTSLDTGTAGEIRALLAELLADLTCVLVTHDAVDAVALAARVCVLEDGRVTQVGAVRDVFAEPATAFVAEQAGRNRVIGVVADGVWRAEGLRIPVPGVADGPAAAVFAPSAVAVAAVDGAVRWRARVTRVEQTIGGARVHAAVPPLAVDVPLAEWAQHPLAPGDEIELSLDPAAVRVFAS
ncbi:MAG: ATP-binding cassette domain-containing protein, partial [Microbacterium sp.]|uniref:ATP-binding cassette domain-containing protein n=1 Tax=Microbacterium sp. TaxID=51671 RepID=UPI0039E33771